MSKIARTTPAPSTALAGQDPFRAMRDVFRWDPFREMGALAAFQDVGFDPGFDVKETKEAFVLKADLPGVKEQDVSVSLTGNRLAIAGKREAEEKKQGEDFYSIERSFGSFTRTFTLPDGIEADKVHAELKDGVFTLMLPKAPGARSKQIPVKTAR